MTVSIDTTLLALLLALSNLDEPLSPTEQAALNKVGKQLDANQAWDLIEKGLIKVVVANDSLNQQYQVAIALLEAVDGQIPSELLPTEAELEQLLTVENKLEKRAGKPKPVQNSQSQEILNMSTEVLKTLNPVETSKKLPLDKLKDFFKTTFNK
ncbi:MAG: hypothetical protein JGK03_23135 [Microcoleus sp. PH2017_25_DOB_D_A]|uniref:hypothetical protein n=1 Tax=unclassified Microcoleus TaxID=2642155 RepID=UPI001DE133CB|nr:MULTISPECIES: hypothetical protein [unclassified Microcoleus]MCC3537013.1 hypothetical protein [Microcoleus sp. PH2017_25_DOB_D_A]MCC3549415.1 hypothetical protein [Microcoleus sp. PH2017_24_DOB_U_A]TAE36056.1 MAG: hypothetical protein EAZ90_29350 [Oscillatoriales cyanobacterium]